MPNPDVLIAGAGLAGLCCARRLFQAGISCRIFEASDRVGGRIHTDVVDGFLLDRGFQVLLTAYPEARRVLNYQRLALGRFEPGALIRYQGKFWRFADPWRRPRYLLATALSPVASFGDKLRIARLRRRVCGSSLDHLYQRPEMTTIELLRREGFSHAVIERFFRPFLGGVFLDRELLTSSRMFDFVFRMFSLGDAALPAHGMAAVARQIGDGLPAGSIEIGARVSKVSAKSLQLENGEQVHANCVVVACEAPSAANLLGDDIPTAGQGVTCLYFAAERTPIEEPVLVLNGDGEGPVNNLCVPSQVVSTYAPPEQALISVTVLGVPTGEANLLEGTVREQLRAWFGADVDRWRLLRTYHIPFALPAQAPPALSPVAKSGRRSDGIFVCGDFLDTASIQGAMLSGRRAAEDIIHLHQR